MRRAWFDREEMTETRLSRGRIMVRNDIKNSKIKTTQWNEAMHVLHATTMCLMCSRNACMHTPLSIYPPGAMRQCSFELTLQYRKQKSDPRVPIGRAEIECPNSCLMPWSLATYDERYMGRFPKHNMLFWEKLGDGTFDAQNRKVPDLMMFKQDRLFAYTMRHAPSLISILIEGMRHILLSAVVQALGIDTLNPRLYEECQSKTRHFLHPGDGLVFDLGKLAIKTGC